jgi:hypothetical protein
VTESRGTPSDAPRDAMRGHRDVYKSASVSSWKEIPDSVRRIITEEARALAGEVRSVRRPRDIRRLMRDPEAVGRLLAPIEGTLDEVMRLVAKGTLPLNPRTGAAAGATTAALAATAGSILEVCAVLGLEAPPLAVAVGGSAVALGMAAETLEFYFLCSSVWTQLRDAGRADPALLRRAVLITYLGQPSAGGLNRVARMLLERTFARLLPVVGIPMAGRAAWRDHKRAAEAVRQVLREVPAQPRVP